MTIPHALNALMAAANLTMSYRLRRFRQQDIDAYMTQYKASDGKSFALKAEVVLRDATTDKQVFPDDFWSEMGSGSSLSASTWEDLSADTSSSQTIERDSLSVLQADWLADARAEMDNMIAIAQTKIKTLEGRWFPPGNMEESIAYYTNAIATLRALQDAGTNGISATPLPAMPTTLPFPSGTPVTFLYAAKFDEPFSLETVPMVLEEVIPVSSQHPDGAFRYQHEHHSLVVSGEREWHADEKDMLDACASNVRAFMSEKAALEHAIAMMEISLSNLRQRLEAL